MDQEEISVDKTQRLQAIGYIHVVEDLLCKSRQVLSTRIITTRSGTKDHKGHVECKGNAGRTAVATQDKV
jgi:hypothetical protein